MMFKRIDHVEIVMIIVRLHAGSRSVAEETE
jgi:hypothetical protein